MLDQRVGMHDSLFESSAEQITSIIVYTTFLPLVWQQFLAATPRYLLFRAILNFSPLPGCFLNDERSRCFCEALRMLQAPALAQHEASDEDGTRRTEQIRI